ncbi:hypothetical protein [Clostridium felsineum]|nr:hypothetical protein [Clostridium felsineum]
MDVKSVIYPSKWDEVTFYSNGTLEIADNNNSVKIKSKDMIEKIVKKYLVNLDDSDLKKIMKNVEEERNE